MNLFHLLKNSVNSLLAHKMRSFLTMLGMIIGIAAVLIIMSIGASAQDLILGQIRSVGSNLIGVLPGASDENGPPATALGITVTTLKFEDAEALAKKENVPHATAVAAYVSGTGTISWQNRSVDASITGTSASYIDVEETEVEFGRFFSTEEENSYSRVVVLGSQIYEDLFEGADPIGQAVKIKREQFKVIGVMKERGAVAFQSQDDQIFIPVKTAQKILLGIDHLGFIRLRADDAKNLDETVLAVKATLRERHGIDDPIKDDFSVRNVAQALSVLTGVTDALKFFLAAIAAIALVVGGIGIMNIMLVSVNERIREVGLRKALGAKNRDIQRQFLLETIAIALGGGLIGISLGIILAALVTVVANYLGYTWNFIVTLNSVVLASSVSVIIGLIFGLYPAAKAAKLDPIEALRYE